MDEKSRKTPNTQESEEQVLRWLEQLGYVPKDAPLSVWRLAQKTTWWGKPLDRQEFWTGRVLWLDSVNLLAARQRGRHYPPLPYDDPRFAVYPHDRDLDNPVPWGVEGPDIRYRYTERESAFWNEFYRSHPRPPESLERKQMEMAQLILNKRYDFQRRGNPARTTTQEIADYQQTETARALEQGYPQEALTEAALFWTYVLKRRKEYQALVDIGEATNNIRMRRLLDYGLVVDPQYITEPLREDQLKAANAWKIAYLRRLRKEKVDESYINAYLEAWNLLPRDVFPDGK